MKAVHVPALHAAAFPSPIGTLTLVGGDAGLAAVLWPGERPGRVPLPPHGEADHPLLDEAARQLRAYFAGKLRTFALPLAPQGTPFQLLVWAELNRIPYGQVRSYGDVARALGQPTAFRAVGAANGRNPISIVTPCHRVIGTDGKLTGFGGGLPAKHYLLALERGDLFAPSELTPPP